MAARTRSPLARLRALLGSDLAGVRNSLLALTVSVMAAAVAGLTLVAAQDELLRLPGLFAMIPGAIALRGNIFGGLGSRLSTSIHTGTFSTTPRAQTVVGQNVLAALVLSLVLSVVLGVLAKTLAVVFGVENTVPIQDYIVVSVVGGILASVVVLAVTLSLAAAAVRWGWDLDDVNAPLVTAAGDVFTIPALLAASVLVDRGTTTSLTAAIFTVLAVAATVLAFRSGLPVLDRILRESLPALSIAAVLSLTGGLIIEKQAEAFFSFTVLLVVLPGFLGAAGSLGGILSSRLSSKLHLGTVVPASLPNREARGDMGAVFAMAVPVFALVAFVASLVGVAVDLTTPGFASVLWAVLLGGLLATVFVSFVAYYGTISAVRLRLDPDTYGIPIVASSLDLIGASTLVLAIVMVGIV